MWDMKVLLCFCIFTTTSRVLSVNIEDCSDENCILSNLDERTLSGPEKMGIPLPKKVDEEHPLAKIQVLIHNDSSQPKNGNEEDQYTSVKKKMCCYVIHSHGCKNVMGQPKCITRIHKECSDFCQSAVMLTQDVKVKKIKQSQEEYGDLVPTGFRNSPFDRISSEDQQDFMGNSKSYIANKCFYVHHYPWIKCRQMKVEDCTLCFFCNGRYSPKVCSLSDGCSWNCRLKIDKSYKLRRLF